MTLDDLLAGDRPVLYEVARRFFARDPQSHWAAYVAGTLLVLMREKGLRPTRGLRLLIDSRVPEGKGVSSSAAIEVATMSALAAATGIRLQGKELAILCQKVENLVVGAPCGVMDQMTSACGDDGQLMALLCQPAELQPSVPIPGDLWVWGIDSGVRHAVSGADYGSVRVGAFMGYRILAELAGLPVIAGGDGEPVQVQDERWHGCLANVAPSEYVQYYESQLPVTLSGGEFLERYAGTTDIVTTVDPDRDYPVRAATSHPVHEHFRVRTFGELMRARLTPACIESLGELMYQSHASYSACGLGCDGTDLLVDLVRELGPAGGLYGAKITGGGSGGTVAVLGRHDCEATVRDVAAQYAEKTGHEPYIFSRTSPGAAAFGVLRLAAR
jgi:L-arabinokinase